MRSSLSRFATTTVVGTARRRLRVSRTSPAPVTTPSPVRTAGVDVFGIRDSDVDSARHSRTHGRATDRVAVASAVASVGLAPGPRVSPEVEDLVANPDGPGPGGGLLLSPPPSDVRVVALLDSAGKPRPGWPIALDDTACDMPAPAADGSIRVVCAIDDPVSRAYAFTPDGRSIAGWPMELPGILGRPTRGRQRPPCDRPSADEQTPLRLMAVAPHGTLRTGTAGGDATFQ